MAARPVCSLRAVSHALRQEQSRSPTALLVPPTLRAWMVARMIAMLPVWDCPLYPARKWRFVCRTDQKSNHKKKACLVQISEYWSRIFLCLQTEKLDIQPSCCHSWSITHLFAGRTYIFSSGGGTREKKSGEERVQETLFLLENIAQTCLAPRILAFLLTTTISHHGELENSNISEFKRLALATALWKLG